VNAAAMLADEERAIQTARRNGDPDRLTVEEYGKR
jgi:hypothetical protein